ncbi:MAG: hydantoinase/oxoprolinase family protein, partial [Oscillospiraceae bacterium]|nr:hydantoinase/oxoprolinase family protein [Oscillospiraceae bacterium]
MKLGIGIDTGGTYTDAVIYDFESGKVLAGAKSLTTRDDLSVGIGGALDNLPPDLLRQAKLASLSTTLATNACVEGKGGRAKLLFIGVGRDTLDRVGADYGISDEDSLFFLDAAGSFDGKELPEIDWDKLLDDAADWMTDADGLGVVELYAMKNGAVIEKKAKELFSERYGVSVICGSELFNGLNSVRRGAGTLLNAKLVPIIAEFMQAIGRAFAARGVNAPVMIVRSDGSLMSEKFARLRPVETILCGPAASVLGGRALAGRENAVIVDMGGTTTDISIVKNGMPVRATEGISIGSWRTFVRGVFIDTFGLGGDSAVRVEGDGVKLETRRVAPISLIARDHPEILPYLEELAYKEHTHTQPIHEFYTLVREPDARAKLTPVEEKLVEALRRGPLPLKQFAEAAGTNVYHLETAWLENEGYLLRCGMTPTDA